MGPRKWLAWKLVQLAARLHDAEWEEVITVDVPGWPLVHFAIVADEYGCGVSATSGIGWTVGDSIETGRVGDVEFTWAERQADA